MRRLLTGALAAVLPALLVGALTIGCSSGDKGNTGGGSSNTGKKPNEGGGGKKTELESKGWGTLKGRVTFAGDRPNIKAMDAALKDQMKANTQDGAFCLSGGPDETNEQKWEIGSDNGVANVFVWLEPDDKHYFKIDWDKKPWLADGKGKLVINQPHCAFKPHALGFFRGSYPDGDESKTLKPSGESLIIENTAPINHNTAWNGGDLNASGSELISAKTDKPLDLTEKLVPSPDPVLIHCDIHRWMSGVVRVYDHPYFAVTDKDGKFEIKHAPAGAELRVLVWHEEGKFGSTGKDGDKVTLDDGKATDKNYTVSAGK